MTATIEVEIDHVPVKSVTAPVWKVNAFLEILSDRYSVDTARMIDGDTYTINIETVTAGIFELVKNLESESSG